MRPEFCFLVVCLVVSHVSAADTDASKDKEVETGIKCNVVECPAGTIACETREDSTEDKKKLEKVIKCLDDAGTVLKEQSFTEDNPYGPHGNYHFYGYSKIVSHNFNILTPNKEHSPGNTAGEADDMNDSFQNLER